MWEECVSKVLELRGWLEWGVRVYPSQPKRASNNSQGRSRLATDFLGLLASIGNKSLNLLF